MSWGRRFFGIPLRTPNVFYYSVLAISAALYAFVLYVNRAPFGLVLQGIRDDTSTFPR